MKNEKILSDISANFKKAEIRAFEKNLDLLLTSGEDLDNSKGLSEVILKHYTTYKSGFLSKAMEIMIRKRPYLALVNHPNNFLFKVAVITGSKDLYECYIEEAAMLFIQDIPEEDHEMFFLGLHTAATRLITPLFNNYVQCIKGMDYNSAFGTLETNENVVLINREDYETLEDVVKKYNAIVGRKNIINDLAKRAGIDE